MAYDANAQRAELLVIMICQSLRWSHDNALARMDAERVKVLHVTNRDAVIITVAHHLIFYLLPAAQALLYQHLRRERECLLGQFVQLLFVVAEARAKAAESISGTYYDRIAQIFGCLAGLLDILACLAADGLDIYFLEPVYKQLPVFGIYDGLDRCTENFHIIFLKHTALVQSHAAVEGRLAAEGQQYALRTLLFYYLLDEERRYR